MSEDSNLLTRRQLIGLFGGVGVAVALGGAEALEGVGSGEGNLNAGRMALSQAYKAGENLWHGPLSARSEVPKEDGNAFIQTDAGTDSDQYKIFHYDGGWVARGFNTPAITTDTLNGIKVGHDWSELKTVVEASGRGDYITVEQGDNVVLQANSQITVPEYVYVNLRGVEVSPQSDTQSLWEVRKGAKVFTGQVLPSTTYSASVFVFDGDTAVHNLRDRTWVGGRINQTNVDGTFVGHEFRQTAGGHVAGVQVDTVQAGGNAYATLESADAAGYINANKFRGRFDGTVNGIQVIDNTGAVDGNELDGMLMQAQSRTSNVLDLSGKFWKGYGQIWDLGKASPGITFQSGAENSLIEASHPSVIPGNMSGGGTDNVVINWQDRTIYMDDGTDMVATYNPYSGGLNLANGQQIRWTGNDNIAVFSRQEVDLVDTNTVNVLPGGGSFSGYLYVCLDGSDRIARFSVRASVTELEDPSNTYTTTQGNDGTVNIFVSAGDLKLENQFGSTQTFNMMAQRLSS